MTSIDRIAEPWGTRTPCGPGRHEDGRPLAQAAQGIRDTDLLALTKRCHPETLRQLRWANAKLEESGTQILVS